MHYFCLDGEDKPSTLEIGEFEIIQQHRLKNRPYPYPRHINRFESKSYRGNRCFGVNYSHSSCQMVATQSAKGNRSCRSFASSQGADSPDLFHSTIDRAQTNTAEKLAISI
ncbi:hypothetical protein ACLFKQ_01540 [Myxosarcina sp. GI1(2024)]